MAVNSKKNTLEKGIFIIHAMYCTVVYVARAVDSWHVPVKAIISNTYLLIIVTWVTYTTNNMWLITRRSEKLDATLAQH